MNSIPKPRSKMDSTQKPNSKMELTQKQKARAWDEFKKLLDSKQNGTENEMGILRILHNLKYHAVLIALDADGIDVNKVDIDYLPPELDYGYVLVYALKSKIESDFMDAVLNPRHCSSKWFNRGCKPSSYNPHTYNNTFLQEYKRKYNEWNR